MAENARKLWIFSGERNRKGRVQQTSKVYSIIPFPRFTLAPADDYIRGGVVRHRLYRFDREPDGKLECLRTLYTVLRRAFRTSSSNRKLISWERQSMMRFSSNFTILYKVKFNFVITNEFILFVSTESVVQFFFLYQFHIYKLRCQQSSMLIIRTGVIVIQGGPPRWNSNREFEDWKVGGCKGIRRRCICQIEDVVRSGGQYIYIYIARLIYSSNNGTRGRES